MAPGSRQVRFETALARLRADVAARAPHEMLPGERDLAQTLALSRTTVRRLLASLVAEGIVTHRQGVGTFVATPTANAPVADPQGSTVRGFSETVRRRGRVPSSRTLLAAMCLPSAEEAQMLGQGAGRDVMRIRRLRCIDGHPVCLDDAVMPAWALTVSVRESLYEALAASGAPPVRSLQRVSMDVAEEPDATALSLVAGAGVAVLRRTDLLQDGRTCAFTRSIMKAQRFDMLVEWSDVAGWDAIR